MILCKYKPLKFWTLIYFIIFVATSVIFSVIIYDSWLQCEILIFKRSLKIVIYQLTHISPTFVRLSSNVSECVSVKNKCCQGPLKPNPKTWAKQCLKVHSLIMTSILISILKMIWVVPPRCCIWHFPLSYFSAFKLFRLSPWPCRSFQHE